LALALLAACRTPEEFRRDADEEVYALVDARRDDILGREGGFHIEPPADSLRQRILREDWDPEHEYSLVECLHIAAENSRDYQTQKESLYRVALSLTLERWRFESRPFGNANADLNGGEEAQNATTGGQVGLTRLLGNGASIVANIGADLFRVVANGDGWDVVSDLGLTFTMPLLRGAGVRIVKEPLTQAERDLVYEVRAFERFRRTFSVDVAGRVYNLLQAQDELSNEERNYKNLVDLRKRNEAMAEAGRLSDIESDQAKQDELRSEATLLRLQTSLERQQDQFNLFLGLPIEAPLRLDPAEFEGLVGDDDVLDGLEEEYAVLYALQGRLDHQTTLDTVDDRRRTVEIAEDALRAGLTLSASTSAGSNQGRPLDFDSTGLGWSTGLALDAPFDRKAERNAYRASLISLQARERDAEEEADRIRAAVRDAMRLAENAAKDYVIQVGAVELNRRRVESTKLNLDAGRASTRDVLESQDALVNGGPDQLHSRAPATVPGARAAAGR
jgi:outer membrane protein TolC